MDQSIGSMLTDLGTLRSQLATPTARIATRAATSDAGSFAAQLDASFRARAEQLGLTLPSTPTVTSPDARGADVDEIWKRVQMQSAARNGLGDALMKAVGDAADARWDKRMGRNSRGLFDM